MTPQGSTNAVVISTFVTLGSTTGASLTNESAVHAKEVAGGLLAMFGCAVVAEVNPDLGGWLAITIAGTAFILYGLPTLNHYFEKEGKKSGKN